MPRPTPEEEAQDESAPDSDEPLASREELEARGDAAGLRELAKAHRTGTRGASKDLKACFACYEAAAKLGDPEAHYALALFLFVGGVVPADTKSAATHLRAAADGGSLDARIYLANLYELGIHYKQDAEKADVWYRSAARAAGLDESKEGFALAMAALGSVRHALPITSDPSTSEGDRAALLAKAKARGYGLKLREERDSVVPSRTPPPVAVSALGETPAPDAPLGSPKTAPSGEAPEKKPAPKPKGKREASRVTIGAGLVAFGYSVVFTAMALGAGYLSGAGAKVLYETRGALPLFGERPDLVFPAVTATLVVLASTLVYRMRTVLSALGAGLLALGVALYLHGTQVGTFLASRAHQALAFSLGAYLAALLVFGVLGGAKPRKG